MLSRIRKYITEGNHFACLEATQSDGKTMYRLLEIKNKGDELYIANWQTAKELDALLANLSKNTPLCLLLNNDQVLTKLILEPQADVTSIVLETFPNLDLEAFYFEVIQEDSRPIVSIAKKSYVDDMLCRIENNVDGLVEFHLGLATLQSILSYLDKPQLQIANSELDIKEGRIWSIRNATSTDELYHLVGGIHLESSQIPAFTGVLTYIKRMVNHSNINTSNNELHFKYRNRRNTHLLTKGMLAFFLLLLMVNFFAFNFYNNRVQDLAATNELARGKQSRYKNLESSVKLKEGKLELLNSASSSKVTYYVDRIANEMPKEIRLDQMIYQPLTMPVREAKPIRYAYEKIHIFGSSTSATEFSNWIARLEALDWIKTVETTGYGSEHGEKNKFTLEIILHEN